MLSPIARRFSEALSPVNITFTSDDGEFFLADIYSIKYGTYSSRIDPESGVKAQNATLYINGRVRAEYHADTDEVIGYERDYIYPFTHLPGPKN